MIEIPRRLRDEMVAHAREGAPEEVCGVLGGRFDPGASRVHTVRRAENAAALPRTAYEIDPEESYRIFRDLEADGEEVVGFYHSHPAGPAKPSATDAARAAWPDRSYVIVIFGDRGGGSAAPEDGSGAREDGSNDATGRKSSDDAGGKSADDAGGKSADDAGAEPEDGTVVRSWRWRGEAFERERVRILDDAEG